MMTYIRMIVVLSAITLISGLALGGLNELTYEKAANNVLKFKKIPAVATIVEAVSGPLDAADQAELENQLLADKRRVDLGGKEPLLLFVIKKDNKPYAVAFERFGQGFGGDLGVMIGYRVDDGKMVGIGITTMAETPGVGTRVTEDVFVKQFRNMPSDAVLEVKKDGGDVDAIAGATVSSRAVAFAVKQARTFFEKHQEQIIKELSR